MFLLEDYISLVERRILNDEWRVGWFKGCRGVEIYGVRCELLLYGHSRYFKQRFFFLPKINLLLLFPYGTVAALFYTKLLDLTYVEEVLSVVKKFMEAGRMETPEGVTWGIDIAFIAIATDDVIPRGIVEYIQALDPNVYDQYMQEAWFTRRIRKKIGVSLVDLRNRVAYASKNIFASEAKRLFNPNLTVIERIKYALMREGPARRTRL